MCPSDPGVHPVELQESPPSHATAASAVLRNAHRSGFPDWTPDFGRPDWQVFSPECCYLPVCASLWRRNSDSSQLEMGQRRGRLFDMKQTPAYKGGEFNFHVAGNPGTILACKTVFN